MDKKHYHVPVASRPLCPIGRNRTGASDYAAFEVFLFAVVP